MSCYEGGLQGLHARHACGVSCEAVHASVYRFGPMCVRVGEWLRVCVCDVWTWMSAWRVGASRGLCLCLCVSLSVCVCVCVCVSRRLSVKSCISSMNPTHQEGRKHKGQHSNITGYGWRQRPRPGSEGSRSPRQRLQCTVHAARRCCRPGAPRRAGA